MALPEYVVLVDPNDVVKGFYLGSHFFYLLERKRGCDNSPVLFRGRQVTEIVPNARFVPIDLVREQVVSLNWWAVC